ncbi:hypothetical protein H6A03_00330 [[Clostridium] spiroforme]|nr:hypothetical protein [Thomasclavelia spiroformis]MBM6879115.1 hypothetical protein [Thomasclavelia spiroformis]
MELIKIVYIDDQPDMILSKYLDNYKDERCVFSYTDVIFNPDDGYESLINNINVKSANIIFIDSKLFENRKAHSGKFTGEEFKIILKKYFPFIEVIVITQNPINDDYKTIPKYHFQSNKDPNDYYSELIKPLMNDSIERIFEVRKIAVEIKKNDNWEDVMIEKIMNSINGQEVYDELTKSDIDQIIKMFQIIQDKIEG